MRMDDSRHGTEAGHEQHLRDGEDSCAACHRADILAGRRRSKRRELGYAPLTVPIGSAPVLLRELRASGLSWRDISRATGLSDQIAREYSKVPAGHLVYARTARKLAALTAIRVATPAGASRRLRALAALGWTSVDMAAASGCLNKKTIRAILVAERTFLRPETREGVLAAYAKLSMTVPGARNATEQRSISRARNWAARQGWAPPLAWDDDELDHPRAVPGRAIRLRSRRPSAVDPGRVQLALDGVVDGDLTRAERLEAVRLLHRAGLNDLEINQRTGIHPGQVLRDRRDLGLAPHPAPPAARIRRSA